MKNRILLALLALALPLSGCKKISALIHKRLGGGPAQTAPAQPAAPMPARSTGPAAPAATPEPRSAIAPATTGSAAETAAQPVVDERASAIAFCYHNIEDNSKMKALTISTAEFEREMQALKDSGYTVIPMQDFLAWRRGEKGIPAKSAIITLDDGWVSGYENAWPILKKYHYPFTLFIYVNYVGTGGKSMSWDQLAEMRDAGVDIECHTYSHSNLRAPGVGVDKKTAEGVRKDIAALGMDGWMRKEIIGSKEVLEKQLGIKVNAFAYPFGIYNQKARDLIKEAGYEAAFTVYGQQLRAHSPPSDLLGRYAVEAGKPQIFQAALNMIGGGVSGPAEPMAAQLAVASMITEPMDNETISNPKPVIKANLATMGAVDPKSVEMRLSGVGMVPAKYDPATKTVTYAVGETLHEHNYTVILTAKAGGRRVETRWSFNFDPSGAAAGSSPAPAKAH